MTYLTLRRATDYKLGIRWPYEGVLRIVCTMVVATMVATYIDARRRSHGAVPCAPDESIVVLLN